MVSLKDALEHPERVLDFKSPEVIALLHSIGEHRDDFDLTLNQHGFLTEMLEEVECDGFLEDARLHLQEILKRIKKGPVVNPENIKMAYTALRKTHEGDTTDLEAIRKLPGSKLVKKFHGDFPKSINATFKFKPILNYSRNNDECLRGLLDGSIKPDWKAISEAI
jgi:hypothetical protein